MKILLLISALLLSGCDEQSSSAAAVSAGYQVISDAASFRVAYNQLGNQLKLVFIVGPT